MSIKSGWRLVWEEIAILMFAIMLLIMSFISREDAHDVKNRNVLSDVIITINGKDIISDSINYFIGKTNHFVFIYNQRDSTPLIYPIEKVEKIIYKLKPPKNNFFDRPLVRQRHA